MKKQPVLQWLLKGLSFLVPTRRVGMPVHASRDNTPSRGVIPQTFLVPTRRVGMAGSGRSA